MKRIIAIALAAVMTFASFAVFGNTGHRADMSISIQAEALSYTSESFLIDDILYEQSPREGYILAPTMFRLSGIDTASSFVLRTPYTFSPAISIDGQPQPAVVREDINTFIITPAIRLTPNNVYIFRITRDGEADITWAFQTSVSFEIASVFPRNQATNVPVRTGIEIEFSFGDAPNIADYFSIYPHVEGSFISRDSVAIFMPESSLAYGMIYTVTIREGITLPNTSEAITESRMFSFETAPSPDQPLRSSNQPNQRISFANRHVEFPAFAEPVIAFWLTYSRDQGRPAVDIGVYHMHDQKQAIAATHRLINAPRWSLVAQSAHFVDTGDLRRVYYSGFSERQGISAGWNERYTLPALPHGFYVVQAVVGDYVNQMIIQVTDIAVQIAAADNMTLIWANDMQTGLPLVDAEVLCHATGITYRTDADGIAEAGRELISGAHSTITARDGRQTTVFLPGMEARAATNRYWSALQLDRTLFRRSDTLSFWGFVQNRYFDEDIAHVTAVLTERSWWGRFSGETLHRQNIPVINGSYSGEISLPNLDPGNYELAIFRDGVLLNAIMFVVMDFVTPPYQMLLSADKAAVFSGEEITFAMRTQFFEGTPVADLELAYNFQGSNLAPRRPTGLIQTDSEGNAQVSITPRVDDTTSQGERAMNFSVGAVLPEIGQVHERASVRVFINDINVRRAAVRTDAFANLTVNVNNITLERLNDGTSAHRNDFLCVPVEGQRLSVQIFEIYWERVQIGQWYDHITRQAHNLYHFDRRQRQVNSFEMITDEEGFAAKDFTVPNREQASYQARITTIDGNGRTIVHYAFIGHDFSSFFRNANENRLFLYGVNTDGYDVGDQVELIVKRGTDPVEQGRFLYVILQNGILSHYVSTGPLTFTFDERHVPNARVVAFHFNGHTYHTNHWMQQSLRFNPANRELVINIKPCQEAYRPGDNATFTIITTDLSGSPKAAFVNVSLVDEALFSLRDYTVDTLAMLYRRVGDNLRFSRATHGTFVSEGITGEIDLVADAFAAGDMAAVPAAAMQAEPGGGEDARIRERFEDTAAFASVRTDSQGRATISFELPDNITSWRLTASAISTDLYAGNTVCNVRVTLPAFLHYSLASVFLTGDMPYVGVNVFGASLTGGERVSFEVWREDAPDDIRRAEGTAFARVNIPLWEKTDEGFGAIIIRASVGEYSDAVRHAYQVIESFRMVDVAVFYEEVSVDTVFDVNPGGLTNITFTDHGRGRFLRDLIGLRHVRGGGARIETIIARREATRLIQEHFPDIMLFGGAGNFDLLEYQTENGGMAILPHSEADLLATVSLMPFILDDINVIALRSYLQGAFDSSPTDNRMLALYGLAMLGEPVLLDLQRYAMLDGLSVRNIAYVAMGFVALGDTQAARDLYAMRILPHIQRVAPYYRVYAGENRAQIMDATSVTALLAARLGMPEALGLHNYAMRDRFFTPEALIEQMAFISHEISNHTADAASITYMLFGEQVTRSFGYVGSFSFGKTGLTPTGPLTGTGGQFTLRIPAQNMHEFELIEVEGNVSAVSVVRVPLEDIEPVENNITIRREFFRAGTNTPTNIFEQDELVRVQITVYYSASAVSGSYTITDFLPAGLAYVPNSARLRHETFFHATRWIHATAEGQRVTFFDFNPMPVNRRPTYERVYFYYARVVNPGVFRAEGTMVQSVGAREYMAVGSDDMLTVNP